ALLDGEDIIGCVLLSHDLATRLPAHHMNVLPVDVLLAQLLGAILIFGNALHDLVGGELVLCVCTGRENPSWQEKAEEQKVLAHWHPRQTTTPKDARGRQEINDQNWGKDPEK